MNIPGTIHNLLTGVALPQLISKASPSELAAAVIHSRRLLDPDADLLGIEKHVADARKLLTDALGVLDHLTKTGKWESSVAGDDR